MLQLPAVNTSICAARLGARERVMHRAWNTSRLVTPTSKSVLSSSLCCRAAALEGKVLRAGMSESYSASLTVSRSASLSHKLLTDSTALAHSVRVLLKMSANCAEKVCDVASFVLEHWSPDQGCCVEALSVFIWCSPLYISWLGYLTGRLLDVQRGVRRMCATRS